MEQQVKRRPFSGPALAWRCIFILQDEPAAIYRAQTLRFGYRNVPCVCRFWQSGFHCYSTWRCGVTSK